MAIHQLSRESVGGIQLKSGLAAHKFITTPFRIFFGDDGEFHKRLLEFWEHENPDLFAEEKKVFDEQSLSPCGSHSETMRLAIVDAGLLLVEGTALPERVHFSGRSESYGLGDRQRTQLLGQSALGGEWKLHLPTPA